VLTAFSLPFLALLPRGGDAFVFDTTAVLAEDAVSVVGHGPTPLVPPTSIGDDASGCSSEEEDDDADEAEDEGDSPDPAAASGEVVDEIAILNFFLWRLFCFASSRLASASRRTTSCSGFAFGSDIFFVLLMLSSKDLTEL
jgi:hypothetical protein